MCVINISGCKYSQCLLTDVMSAHRSKLSSWNIVMRLRHCAAIYPFAQDNINWISMFSILDPHTSIFTDPGRHSSPNFYIIYMRAAAELLWHARLAR